MSVRRLHGAQPEHFEFTPQNLIFAKRTIAQYPAGKQASAIIALLWRAQEQCGGWLPRAALEHVAKMLDMAFIRAYEVASFYTMFQLHPVGSIAHVQVCGTTPCMLRGAEDLKKVCKAKINVHSHTLSADGKFSWEEVECLGACVNAPMIQIWKECYEDLTPEKLAGLLDDLAQGKPVQPGPQNGRQHSAPLTGQTTLTDPELYSGKRVFARAEPAAELAATPAAPAAAAAPTAPPIPAAPILAARPVAEAPKPIDLSKPLQAPQQPTAPQPTAPQPTARVTPPAIKPSAQKSKRTAKVMPEKKPGQPALLSKPKGGKGDDLKLIWGVGPALEKMLNNMGVWHFSQIAGWSAADLRWVDERLEGFKGRAKRDEWIKQSKKLATGWRPGNSAGERPKGRA